MKLPRDGNRDALIQYLQINCINFSFNLDDEVSISPEKEDQINSHKINSEKKFYNYIMLIYVNMLDIA